MNDRLPLPARPYADAAQLYRDAGWRGVIPVQGKYPPPTGWTGAEGSWPSGADIASWVEDHGSWNIALRLPPDVVGVDIDAYGDKRGAATLAECEARWGPLPQTWRSTSRNDGTSGIRLFVVPPGLRWPGQLPGGGVELVTFSHRYCMTWPSIHPNGGTYRWTKDGVVSIGIPAPEELPALPGEWLIGLVKGPERHDAKSPEIADGAQWVAALPGAKDEPCEVMEKALAAALTRLRSSGSRHDDCVEMQLDLVRLAESGHPGGIAVLTKLGEVFVGLVGDERVKGAVEARTEYLRALNGASAIVAASLTWPPPHGDPCIPPPVLGPLVIGQALATVSAEPRQVSTWGEKADLAAALLGELQSVPPTELAREDGVTMLYAGKVNALLGPSESGKTWLALLAAAQAMNAGRSVVMLDFEDDVLGLVSRLRSLGVADDVIRERMTYLSPAEPLTADTLADLMGVLTEADPSLIILDGVNAAMTTMGLDLISNQDATTFHLMLLLPMSRTGAAVVVVDHTPKNDVEGISRGGIGAQAKRATITGAAIRVEVLKNFSRTRAGTLKLIVDKDRGGHVRAADTNGVIGLAHFVPGEDGAMNVTIEAQEPSENEAGDFRPTTLMDRVATYLADNPGASQRAIMAEHFGKDKYVKDAIDALVEDGYVSRADGPNRAKFHSLIRVWPGSAAPVWPSAAPGGDSGGAARGRERSSTPPGRTDAGRASLGPGLTHQDHLEFEEWDDGDE